MGMNREEYTDENYWKKYWSRESRLDTSFYFDKLLNRYISWDKVCSYMEVGGAPGSIMVFINQKHGLSVSAVDFIEKERISGFLKSHGVENYRIYQEDFLTFDVKPHWRRYDIVSSWGFIEHFDRKNAVKCIEKQKHMVSCNGYLVVELPNIRKLFWAAYWVFNRELLKIHNLKIMDLHWLKKCVLKGGEFELLFASYYFTMNPQNEYFIKHKKIRNLCEKAVRFFDRRNFSDNIKQWFFPYIVIIAKRK